MNPAGEAELDYIQARANYTECDEATEKPGPSLELIGAVTTPRKDAMSMEGWHPLRKGKGKCQSKEALASGLLFLSHAQWLRW